jgi:hypothetical protein
MQTFFGIFSIAFTVVYVISRLFCNTTVLRLVVFKADQPSRHQVVGQSSIELHENCIIMSRFYALNKWYRALRVCDA